VPPQAREPDVWNDDSADAFDLIGTYDVGIGLRILIALGDQATVGSDACDAMRGATPSLFLNNTIAPIRRSEADAGATTRTSPRDRAGPIELLRSAYECHPTTDGTTDAMISNAPAQSAKSDARPTRKRATASKHPGPPVLRVGSAVLTRVSDDHWFWASHVNVGVAVSP